MSTREFQQHFAMALAALRAGQTVALSTDTVWGIAVDPMDLQAVERLYEQKGRPADKALQVLCDSPATALQFVTLSDRDARRWEALSQFWPGGLTVVAPANGACPVWLTKAGKVGLRVPAAQGARQLLAAFGGHLAASSLNRSGELPARSYEEALALGIADVVLPGEATGEQASTVFDLADGRVLREGVIPGAAIRDALEGAGA